MGEVYTYTHTYTGGTRTDVVSTTISLPSQTTPFTTPAACSATPSVGCSEDYCYRFQLITSNQYDGYLSDCWPSGYASLYWELGDQALLYGDLESIAYPGTACPESWSSACTKTRTSSDGDAFFTQTWCCPESWACHDDARLCVRSVESETAVWLYDTDGGTYSQGATSDFVAYVAVFPLETDSPHRVEAAGGDDASDTVTSNGGGSTPSDADADADASADHESDGGGLSTGGIVGLAVGLPLLFLALAGFFIFWWRRKRAAKASGACESRPPAELPVPEVPCELPVPPAVVSAHSSEKSTPTGKSAASFHQNAVVELEGSPTVSPTGNQARFLGMSTSPTSPHSRKLAHSDV